MNPIYILVSPEAADPGWKCRLRFWFASLRNEYIHINHHIPVSTLTQIYQNLTFCMPRNPRWVWMSGTPYGATIVHRFSYAPFISVPRHLVCDSLGWAWIGDQSADAMPKSLPRCWATLLRPVFSGWKDVEGKNPPLFRSFGWISDGFLDGKWFRWFRWGALYPYFGWCYCCYYYYHNDYDRYIYIYITLHYI